MVNYELKSATLTDTKNTLMLCSIRLVLLALMVCLVYANTLDNQFVFDDSRIYNNPHLRITSLDWGSLQQVVLQSEPATRPVANLSFALNYFLHGYGVGGYHIVNLLIHLLNGILLYFLTLEIFRTAPLRHGQKAGRDGLSAEWIAFFAALLWLVHPIQTQSVTYVVQRMNSMAALFYTASLLLYVRGRIQCAVKRRYFLFGASFLSGLLALGCKEISVTLPFSILLFEWFFLQDMEITWLRRHKLHIAVVFALLVGIALFLLGRHPVESILATYEVRSFTLPERLMTESRVLFFYISLLLLPLPGRLNLDHDIMVSTSLLDPYTTLLSIAGLVVLVVLGGMVARRERLFSFALFWFLGNLVVESTVIGLELVFEHRVYLPSMMLCVVFVVAVDRFIRSHPGKIAGLIGLTVLLALGSFERNKIWQNQVSLWSDAAAKSPDKARPHNNLGVALRKAGRLPEAVEQYSRVIAIDPQFLEAYNNQANVFIEMGRRDEALSSFYRALEINPGHPVIHNNVGKLLTELGRYDRALMHFSEAIRLQPDYQEARINMQSAHLMWKSGGKGKGGLPPAQHIPE